jgi:hypothetical protein
MTIKALVESTDATLRELGFFKDGLVWNRSSGEVVEVIDLQVSKSKSEVTINCGVFHKEAYSIVWGRELTGIAEEPLCVIRARVGELVDGHDTWWEISDEATKDALTRAVAEYCLPFLEKVRSARGMEEYLEKTAMKQKYPLPRIYLATIQVLNGKREAGCSLLADIQKSAVGDWRGRAHEVETRLAC